MVQQKKKSNKHTNTALNQQYVARAIESREKAHITEMTYDTLIFAALF